MKFWRWIAGFSIFCSFGFSTPIVPILNIQETITSGTASYIETGIKDAEKESAPFIVLLLDTPGGLLSSTRVIAQKILNSKIPVVVFVYPKGAHAGSAGALITFGADVAAMAPGTQLGAAHPVRGAGTTFDKVLDEKVTNDTAAFAESLAKNRGRNAEWAVQAVRQSSSVGAEEALKLNAIDLIAEDVNDLLKKLSKFPLRVAKQQTTRLPEGPWEVRDISPSITQKLLSFFSSPDLAYLILVFGGLCLWIELTHPGLIVPGVLGALALAVSLVSFQLMPIHYGALILVLLGMAFLVAELYLPTFGILGLAGIASFVLGSIFLIDTPTPEFRISLSVILPSAALLVTAALFLGWLVLRSRKLRPRSGMAALVGQIGEVREPVSETTGKIFVCGELWNAKTLSSSPIPQGTRVLVTHADSMLLLVSPMGTEAL